MAYPTELNGQITDAVTQANVTVLADAPAVALAGLYQQVAAAAGLAAANQAAAQARGQTLALAVTTRCVQALLGDRSVAG